MKVEAKIGLKHAKSWNVKDCQESPEAGREVWHGFSLRASKRNQPCQCPPLREQRLVILNYPVCGTLCYGSSRELRYPNICLWKSYLNVKVWVLHFSFPISWRCSHTVNCCYLFAPREIYPSLYLTITELHAWWLSFSRQKTNSFYFDL